MKRYLALTLGAVVAVGCGESGPAPVDVPAGPPDIQLTGSTVSFEVPGMT